MSGQTPSTPFILVAMLTALGAVAGVLLLLAHATRWGLSHLSGGRVEVGVGILVFAFLFYASATIVGLAVRKAESDEPVFIAMNVALHVVFLCIGWAILRPQVPVAWLGFAIGFTAVVQGGAYGFARLRQHHVGRLRQGRETCGEVEAFFRTHSAAYVAIPIGAVTGTIAGVATGGSSADVLRDALAGVFAMIALALLLHLALGFRALVRDFMVVHEKETVTIEEQDLGGQSYLVVHAPEPSPETIGQGVDAAVIAADIRKIFLVNQLQQIAVLVMCTLAFQKLELPGLPYQGLVLGLLAFAFLTTQVPYFIGQLRTHDRVLYPLQGEKREETRERLHKRAPAVPTPASWAAFIGTGTLGGVAYKLLEGLVTGLVK